LIIRNPGGRPVAEEGIVGKGRGKWNRCLLVLDAVLVLLLAAYIFLGKDRVPFHGDESTLIHMSLDSVYLFDQHRPEIVAFKTASSPWTEDQFQRVMTGAIDSLTIGAAWHIAGMTEADINKSWVWFPPQADEWEFNVNRGAMPSVPLLTVARTPSALLTVLSMGVVLAVVWLVSQSRWAAWAAALIYATTPSVLLNGERAMQEGAMLFFTSALILGALLVVGEMKGVAVSWPRLTLWLVLLGVASGLAMASKHMALMVVLAGYLAVLLFPFLGVSGSWPNPRGQQFLRLLSLLIGSGLLAVTVFYLVMPVWWAYPYNAPLLACLSLLFFTFGWAARCRSLWLLRLLLVLPLAVITIVSPGVWVGTYKPAQIIIRSRSDLISVQKEETGYMATTGARLGMMAHQLFFAGGEYAESPRWSEFAELRRQIQAYERAFLDGRGGGVFWGVVLILALGLGIWAMVSTYRGGELWVIGLWLLVPAAILLVTNPLPWQRYYVILFPPFSVVAGLGVARTLRLLTLGGKKLVKA
jgi:4-amino-4-deoxy-L-arabinose transferase-like glycosyltransferase